MTFTNNITAFCKSTSYTTASSNSEWGTVSKLGAFSEWETTSKIGAFALTFVLAGVIGYGVKWAYNWYTQPKPLNNLPTPTPTEAPSQHLYCQISQPTNLPEKSPVPSSQSAPSRCLPNPTWLSGSPSSSLPLILRTRGLMSPDDLFAVNLAPLSGILFGIDNFLCGVDGYNADMAVNYADPAFKNPMGLPQNLYNPTNDFAKLTKAIDSKYDNLHSICLYLIRLKLTCLTHQFNLDSLGTLLEKKLTQIKDESEKTKQMIERIREIFNSKIKIVPLNEKEQKYLNNPFRIVWASNTQRGEGVLYGCGVRGERRIFKVLRLGEDIQYAYVDKENMPTLQTALKGYKVEILDINTLLSS